MWHALYMSMLHASLLLLLIVLLLHLPHASHPTYVRVWCMLQYAWAFWGAQPAEIYGRLTYHAGHNEAGP
jgi:hypothetical protein